MKTYICEICGDAYVGDEKPKNCPFCGAREAFIKEGKDAKPIVNNVKTQGFAFLTDVSRKNLEETLVLETRANAIYLCMADKAETYEIKAMYKRLAKVELEHATIATKFLGIQMSEIKPETCNEDDVENFKRTVELEENATRLYSQFAREATEREIRILFTALTQAEEDHIELIKNYLQ